MDLVNNKRLVTFMFNNPYSSSFPLNPTYNYLPQYQQMPQQVAPVSQPAQAVTATSPGSEPQKKTNCEWIYVNGVNGVREHIVQPNQKLYFLDNNDPVFYVKAADNFGTSQIKAYRFSEIIDMPHSQNQSSGTDDMKNEIKEIKNRLSNLEVALNESAYKQHRTESDITDSSGS